MILLVNAANRAAHADLLDQMFRARHDLFVDLKGWEDLRAPDGRERDPWDRADTVYLLALREDAVVGGARFTDASGLTLAGAMLPELFADDPPSDAALLEMSRLFSEPAERKDRPDPIVADLLVAAAELALIAGGLGALTLIELRLAQTLLAWGGHPEPLGLPLRTRDGMLMAVLNHGSALAARNLRRARRIREPLIWWRESPSDPPRRYADILRIDPLDSAWRPPGAFTPIDRANQAPHVLAEAYWRPRMVP